MIFKNKLFNGILWVFTDTFLVGSFQFIALILLARWLGPKDFGLIGMIAIFIEIGKSVTDSGLSNSLIRTKAADNSDYSTVFFMNIFMSIIIYLISFFSAPFVANFYNEPILVDLIRFYCLIFIIIGFSTVQLAILTKKMNFRRITMINSPAIFLGVIIGLYLGYNGFGVWSIIWMYLTIETFKSIFFWLFSSWKPCFVFSTVKFQYHFNFGYKLMLSQIISTMFRNIYNVLIGKNFSTQTLGYFERSRQLCEYPSAALTTIISKVSYPFLSEIQDNKVFLEKTYKDLIKISFFVISPLMLSTAAIAKPLFLILLGDEWVPAVVFFQILSLSMMLYPIHAFNLNILKVSGRSDLFLKLEIIKKVIAGITIVIAFQFGVLGLVWSSVFTSFAALSVNMFFSSKVVNYPVLSQLKDLSLTLILSLITAVLMYYFSQTLLNTNLIVQLLLSYTFGAVFYIGVNYINKKSPLHLTLNLLKKQNR